MRFSSIVWIFTLTIDLAIAPGVPAQEIQLESNRTLALLFSKPLASVVSVEQTTDFVSWSPTGSSTEVVSQGTNNETVRSTVAFPSGTRRFFVRLRVENGWKAALSWQRSLGQDVIGYCLHYGVTPGDYTRTLDVGSRVHVVVSLPLTSKTCYFVVTAYNAIGLQSAPSPEVKVRLGTK